MRDVQMEDGGSDGPTCGWWWWGGAGAVKKHKDNIDRKSGSAAQREGMMSLLGVKRGGGLDGGHVVEGVVQLLADGLVLQFLGVQLILQVVDGLLKLGD